MNRLFSTARPLSGSAILLAGALVVQGSGAQAAPAAAQDLGVTPAQTVLQAAVVLPMADKAGFENALKARYTYGNPLFHHWMTPGELAAFGPKAADLAAVRKALSGYGLTVTSTSRTGAWLAVSGTAGAMQRAFGTAVHTVLADGELTYAHTAAVRPQGALAGRISGVSGLTTGVMHPMIAHQLDADGRRVPGVAVPAAGSAAASPLASFTNQCFQRNGQNTTTLSGSSTTAVYQGVGYELNGLTCGYTPQQIAQHYGLDQAYPYVDGTGQTIVIVDAYGSPTAMADANTFFAAVGIKPFDSTNFQIITPVGAPTTVNYGWAGETALDIELAHAIAPGAKIVLAVAPTASNANLQAVVQYAVTNHLGNVVSNSYGQAENTSSTATIQAWDTLSQEAAAAGISLNFSTGDDGDYSTVQSSTASSSPSDSSYATAVGGTSIDIPSRQGVVETGWGNYRATLGTATAPLATPTKNGFFGGGGGGVSAVIAKPPFQSDLPGNFRLEPDLGLIADPYTGAIIVEPQQNAPSVFTTIGGTSLAAPVFSAMWALVNQGAGWNQNTQSYTPNSSFGAAAPQLAQFQNQLLQDSLPVTTEDSLLFGGEIITGGTTTTVDGYDVLGIPQNLDALTVLRQSPSTGTYSALSFNTDTSLTTAVGYDSTTGRGVPNGVGAVALAFSLFVDGH